MGVALGSPPGAYAPAASTSVPSLCLAHRDRHAPSIAVETGSFSGAVQSLSVKPSTITKRIVRLEDELGVTILERGAFGIRLTAADRELLVAVRGVLDAVDAVTRIGRSRGDRTSSPGRANATDRSAVACPRGMANIQASSSHLTN
jgi:hypothetical protein